MSFKNLGFLVFLGLLTGLFSCKTEENQETTDTLPSVTNNDAERARPIELSFPLNDTIISIDSGNTGGGNAQEFNSDSASIRHTFSKEDNSEWYKLTCTGDVCVGFTITPKDPAAELDFVLIRTTGDNFSTELAAGRLKALRSNSNPASSDGVTGLACDASLRYHGSDGGSMSRAFVLRKEQSYFLVVNSPNGRSSGYSIAFTACAPGADGFFTAFEGDPLNPEIEAEALPDSSTAMAPEQEVKEEVTAETPAADQPPAKPRKKPAAKKNAGSAGSEMSDNGETISYVVNGQETLYSIAFRMGMSVDELMELNGLKNFNIKSGQKLKVIPRNLSKEEVAGLNAGSKEPTKTPSKSVSKSGAKPASSGNLVKTAPEKTNRSSSNTAVNKKPRNEVATKGGQNSGSVDPMESRNTETLSGRNPNFNPTPNFPVNNPKVTQGVETSNSLAPADKSFYVYCNVTSGVNKNPVAGVLQVVDLKKKDLVYNVQANRTQAVPLFNAGGKQKLLICDIFGYKKQDFDLNLDNIINDSTAQQVQIVDDTIVINFELRRLVKGDVAVAYNIFFYDDASVMLPKSTYELDQLLELMQENKKIKVRIHGHTNTSKLGKILYLEPGDKNFFRFTARNKEMFGPAKMLSKKRAETIKMYLESKRITADRIETEGHGGSQMLYPNTHPLAFKNKRVEVEILEDK